MKDVWLEQMKHDTYMLKRTPLPGFHTSRVVRTFSEITLRSLQREAKEKWTPIWHLLGHRLETLHIAQSGRRKPNKSLDARVSMLADVMLAWTSFGAHLGLNLYDENERTSLYRCAWSGCKLHKESTPRKTKACKGCRAAYYCTRTCQRR